MKLLFQNKIIQVSFFLLIAFALIFWQYSALDENELSEIRESFSHTQWHYLFIAFFIGFLSHYFRALRWQLMIRHTGHTTRQDIITASVLMGYLTNLLIPRLGEVMKCTTLYKYNEVPVEKSLGTVISERIFDVLSLLLLFALVLLVEYQQVSNYAAELIAGITDRLDISFQWWWVLIALAGAGVIILLLKFLHKKAVQTRAGDLMQSFILGIRSIITLRKRGLFFVYTIGIWLSYILMVYIAMKAVPATAHLPFSVSAVLTAFGSIAIILTPGGIGAYPPVIAGLLSIYNIPYSYGLSAGWVSWMMQTVVVIILGIATLIYLPVSKHKIIKS